MKKTFFLAAVASLLFASCKKEGFNRANEPKASAGLALPQTANTASLTRVDLNDGLDAWFPFNGTLSDTLGTLTSKPYPYNTTGNFAAGHRGRDRALKLDGTYFVQIGFPAYRPKSLSVWLKRPIGNASKMIVGPACMAPGFIKTTLCLRAIQVFSVMPL